MAIEEIDKLFTEEYSDFVEEDVVEPTVIPPIDGEGDTIEVAPKPSNDTIESDVVDETENANKQEVTEESNDNYFIELANILSEKGNVAIDIDNDTDENTFWSRVNESYIKKTQEDLGAAATEEAKQVYEYLSSGGSLATLNEYLSKNDNPVAKLDADSEVGQKAIVESYYKSIGVSADRTKLIIDALEDSGELSTEALQLKQQIDNDFKAKIAEQVEVQKQLDANNKEYRNSIITGTLEALNQDDVYGIKLPKAQRNKLRDYMFKPIVHRDEKGNVYRTTQAELQRQKLQANPIEYFIKVSLLEMNNLNIGNSTEATTSNKSITDSRSLYEKMTANRTVKRKSNVEPIDNFFN